MELEGASGVASACGGVEDGTGDPLERVGAKVFPPDAVDAAIQLSTERRAGTSEAEEKP